MQQHFVNLKIAKKRKTKYVNKYKYKMYRKKKNTKKISD